MTFTWFEKSFGIILTSCLGTCEQTLLQITQANEIASKASLSGGYKRPLIRDEPSVFIERDLRNIALINFLAEACL